ncbi:MAG: LAGLIDADG family homing endonuclease [Candidatus Yonathbacteria bacterium]|nr:LAGLIDADG family homing endonuclease [Candidatus Yonathbacteria bacterium]
MRDINPDYIVGLVDGEGSFTVYVKNIEERKNIKRRVRVEPKFYLKLIEKDKHILDSLQQFFGCGSVYFQKDTRPNHQNCYRYEVYRRDDLNGIIIPFFQKNKLKFSSKGNDFKIFCKIMSMINTGDHLNKSGLKKMFARKQTMH